MELASSRYNFLDQYKMMIKTPRTYCYIMDAVGKAPDPFQSRISFQRLAFEEAARTRKVIGNEIEFTMCGVLYVIKSKDPAIYTRDYSNGMPVDKRVTLHPQRAKGATYYYIFVHDDKGKRHPIRTYQLKLLVTNPILIPAYFMMNVEINHMFICHTKDAYTRSYELPEHLEITSSAQNLYHKNFVNACKLLKYRVPVEYIGYIECAFYCMLQFDYFPTKDIDPADTVKLVNKHFTDIQVREVMEAVYKFLGDKNKWYYNY